MSQNKMSKKSNMYGSCVLALTMSHYVVCTPLVMPFRWLIFWDRLNL